MSTVKIHVNIVHFEHDRTESYVTNTQGLVLDLYLYINIK